MITASGENILLIVPPFQTTARPALGVSQLKANLQAQGFATRILYLNLRFAERIGLDLYEWISEKTYDTLLGEFIFSDYLFHHSPEQVEQYVQQVLVGTDVGDHLTNLYPGNSRSEVLRQCMQEASDFCRHAAMQEIQAHDPWMVGLTSSFQQNCSSLALIRAIKQIRPDTIMAMGGANCTGEMGEELFKQFPEIDYIGQGECDHSLVELVRSLQNGSDAPPLHGILSRASGRASLPSRPLSGQDLDRMPFPDFSDYFDQVAAMNGADRIAPGLVMETSRGCWWGAKQHCTFCGLNAEDMGFRSKSAPRAMDELATVVNQYGARHMAMADNILDTKYFKTLLPRLAQKPLTDIFYETKASLSKAQIDLLARCRVKSIQPGIESFSDRALQLMRKGTTMLQNVQLLKWCGQAGIAVGWNYLYGFPGEDEVELDGIGQEMEAVYHLHPPGSARTIRLDRFSPYFTAPSTYGLEPVSPGEPYRHVYPFGDETLKRIAYFYHTAYFAETAQSDAFKRVKGFVAEWTKAYSRSYLVAIPRSKSLIILDTRPCARRLRHRLTGMHRKVYEFCDKTHSLQEIRRTCAPVGEEQLQAILDYLVQSKLMLQANGRYLSLAVDPQTNYGKTAHKPTGGFIRPLKRSDRIRRDLARLATFKIGPRKIGGRIAQSASTACRRLSARIASRKISFLTHLLTESTSRQSP